VDEDKSRLLRLNTLRVVWGLPAYRGWGDAVEDPYALTLAWAALVVVLSVLGVPFGVAVIVPFVALVLTARIHRAARRRYEKD
jgi:Flp pilus assembly protein TadB